MNVVPVVFSSEKALERHISDHTEAIFGERIHWHASERKLPGDAGLWVFADLVGSDAQKTPVIVEVKLLRPESERKYDLAREAIGQVLHYAYAYLSKRVNLPPMLLFDIATASENVPSDDALKSGLSNDLRLFIVGEAFSQPVENMCRMLRAFGINIEHLYVNPKGEPPP